MSDNLDTLRKVAEAATQGVWERFDVTDLDAFGVTDLAHVLANELETEDAVQAVATGVTREDATHIAMFDPPTVLALLSRLEQAEAQVARVLDVLAKDAFDVREAAFWADGVVESELIRQALVGLTQRQADEAEYELRKLHKSVWSNDPFPGGVICKECGDPVESEPCDVIRALDGDGRG